MSESCRASHGKSISYPPSQDVDAPVIQIRRRTIRNNIETVDVECLGQRNNGNISVVPDEELRPAIEFEEMIINKRRYRVPEKIIRLDFWDKLGLGKG